MTALATLIWLFLAWTGRRRTIPLLFLGLAIMLVLLAGSATALVITVTMVGLIPLLKTLRRDARLTVVFGCVGVLMAGSTLLFLVPSLDALAGMVGRDVTLTGRTGIWLAVALMIGERPWLGYGYETFWLRDFPFRLPVDAATGYGSPHAHNGFLEVALALGFLGLFLFLFLLLRGTDRAVRLLRTEGGSLGLWPLVYLGFLGLYNLTEVTALGRLSICWVLLVTTLLEVSPKTRRETGAPGATSRHARPNLRSSLSYGSARQAALSRTDDSASSRASDLGS